MSLIERVRRRSPGYLFRMAIDTMRQWIMTRVWTGWFRLWAIYNGIRCGKRLEIYGPVRIRSVSGNIYLGDHVQIISSSWRCTASAISHPTRLRTFMPSARIVFEEGSGISGGSVTARSKTIRIGKKTAIGPDCLILDSNFHLAWPPEERDSPKVTEEDQDVTIGSNVWIGARCTILKGVTIGDNSVIAAGSVVTSSIPANSLARGCPAKVIKTYADSSRQPR